MFTQQQPTCGRYVDLNADGVALSVKQPGETGLEGGSVLTRAVLRTIDVHLHQSIKSYLSAH